MARVGLSGVVPLTTAERLHLEVSAAGGAHFFRLSGAASFRVARGLERRGLGEIDGNEFRATPAGLAAITSAIPEAGPSGRRAAVPVTEADLPF